MPRINQSPKKFIISCRVNDREMRDLHQRARESGLSITMLLRQSLDLQTMNHGRAMSQGGRA